MTKATTQQIKHRRGHVLFECEIPASIKSGMAVWHALGQAVIQGESLRGAVLSGADLSGSDLSGSDLSGADLRDSVLSDSDLSGADLSYSDLSYSDLSYSDLRGADLSYSVLRSADLRGADGKPLPRADAAEAVDNLDRVRAIVLDDKARLEMNHWHGDDGWVDRTCAEETLCGTTHCLAGWLQVCSTKPELRGISAELAGVLAAPVAAKMFFRKSAEVLPWLEGRKYVEEIAEGEARRAARIAAKAAP
jgi:hypothetical protein